MATSVVPAKQTTVDTSTFIVIPSQLVKQFGTKNKRAWFLDFEEHVGQAAILLISRPGCMLCHYMMDVLSKLQRHAFAKYNAEVLVYVMQAGPQFPKSETVCRSMNVTKWPHLFSCKTTTGRLMSLSSGMSDAELQSITVDELTQKLLNACGVNYQQR